MRKIFWLLGYLFLGFVAVGGVYGGFSLLTDDAYFLNDLIHFIGFGLVAIAGAALIALYGFYFRKSWLMALPVLCAGAFVTVNYLVLPEIKAHTEEVHFQDQQDWALTQREAFFEAWNAADATASEEIVATFLASDAVQGRDPRSFDRYRGALMLRYAGDDPAQMEMFHHLVNADATLACDALRTYSRRSGEPDDAEVSRFFHVIARYDLVWQGSYCLSSLQNSQLSFEHLLERDLFEPAHAHLAYRPPLSWEAVDYIRLVRKAADPRRQDTLIRQILVQTDLLERDHSSGHTLKFNAVPLVYSEIVDLPMRDAYLDIIVTHVRDAQQPLESRTPKWGNIGFRHQAEAYHRMFTDLGADHPVFAALPGEVMEFWANETEVIPNGPATDSFRISGIPCGSAV